MRRATKKLRLLVGVFIRALRSLNSSRQLFLAVDEDFPRFWNWARKIVRAQNTLIDAGTRPRRLTTVGGKLQAGELRDDAFVQDAVGRAEAILAAARAYLFNTISEVWDELVGGREIPPRPLAHFLDGAFARLRDEHTAVELVYKARGCPFS